jgi:oligopeptide/dipeptide ABC transporter ATP-binding protein
MPSREVKLVELKDVVKQFDVKITSFKKAILHALNRVNLTIYRGRTIALVGESGCGKTTLGKVILGLLRPEEGEVFFKGTEIGSITPHKRRGIQKNIQMIFQDPFSSLNPRKKVHAILERPLKTFGKQRRSDRKEIIIQICKHVGLDESYLQRYPHQFSGGQRQRIAIARAIILNPSLVIADEAVSALDVSIQAQILNLMMDLQDEFDLTYLFITHDISVVKHLSDHVAVMYLGEIVEWSEKKDLFERPMHPYTRLLFSAVPDINNPFISDDVMISGEPPNPIQLPRGCFFAPRCPYSRVTCRKYHPDLSEVDRGHLVRCFVCQ